MNAGDEVGIFRQMPEERFIHSYPGIRQQPAHSEIYAVENTGIARASSLVQFDVIVLPER